MFVRGKSGSPRREREGFLMNILLQAGDLAESSLAVTWVELAPGASQKEHTHPPEQVYVIFAGRGRMHVGGESREVSAGDLAQVPGGVPHYIVNTGEQRLTYVSASPPAFDVASHYGKL